jgi:hypothetical protein
MSVDIKLREIYLQKSPLVPLPTAMMRNILPLTVALISLAAIYPPAQALSRDNDVGQDIRENRANAAFDHPPPPAPIDTTRCRDGGPYRSNSECPNSQQQYPTGSPAKSGERGN